MKKKKHEHEWQYWEIRGVYDGILYKDCHHCPKRVVFHADRYERWQKEHSRSDQFKEVEYN